MATSKIKVGLIGANPDKGWGQAVHAPVLGLLEDFELTAVATTREDTARRSAEIFGARDAFSNASLLIEQGDVDVIAITVKAPDHYTIAMKALNAGKHVYCEWPLAATTAQAQEMSALAASKRLRAMVGLQSRGAPALRRLRHLLNDGYVGRLISVRLNCSLPGGGSRRSQEGLYVIDRKNGASTLAIQGGHAMDALRYCVGEFEHLSATVANQFPTVEVIETGEKLVKDAPDQILVSGSLKSGPVVSVSIYGGVTAGHSIKLECFGEKGVLVAGWQGPLNFQMSELELFGAQLPDRALARLDLPEAYESKLVPPGFCGRQPYPGVDVPRATLVNVAALYERLGRAINGPEQEMSPDFTTGLSLHRLLDAIEKSSDTGAAWRSAG